MTTGCGNIQTAREPRRFIQNAWYVAAWSGEVSRALMTRRLLDKPVLLYRAEDGQPVALEDRCCHKFLPLSMGTLQGDNVQCGYHGLTFDREGACIHIPGQDQVPDNMRVRHYPTAEHLGMIWFWPGDPAQADKALLFDLPEYDDPAWTVSKGPLTPIAADYRHMTDNLLDPAHVAFVHLSTLGSPTMADIPVKTTRGAGQVTVERWTLDQGPVPIFKAFGDFSSNVDRWQYYHFTPPSICVVDFGAGPVGMDHSDAARDAAMRIHSCHFMTPESATSTHYFWMQIRNFAPGDEKVSARMTEQFVLAFNEDKAILEAVQRAETEEPDRAMMKLAIDRGPNLSRHMIDRIIRDETSRMAE